MKKILVLFLSCSLFTVLSCNKSDSGGSGGDGRVSVLGAAKTPGYMPDGSKADPLSKPEAEQVINSFQGPIAANTALYGSSEATIPGSSFAVLGKTKMFSFSKSILARPESFVNSALSQTLNKEKNDKLVEDLKKRFQQECFLESKPLNLVTNGSNTSGSVSGEGSFKLSGASCPVDSFTKVSVSGNYSAAGEQNINMNMNAGFSSQTTTKAQDVIDATDLLSENIQGAINAAVAQVNNNQAVELHFQLKGEAQTKSIGNVSLEFLSDLYTNGVDGKMANMTLDVAVIAKAQNHTLLLQIFIVVSGGKTVSQKAYLNGEEIPLQSSDKIPEPEPNPKPQP